MRHQLEKPGDTLMECGGGAAARGLYDYEVDCKTARSSGMARG